MPTQRGTTKQARDTWHSPDGKVTAYELLMDVDGADFRTQTYSKAIATPGWTGEFETYEKNSRTFIKQPQKEAPAYGGGKAKSTASDAFTFYLSYAKDVAVAMLDKAGDLDEDKYGKVLAAIQTGGETLYEQRPEAKPKESEEITVEDVSGGDGDDPWAGIKTL